MRSKSEEARENLTSCVWSLQEEHQDLRWTTAPSADSQSHRAGGAEDDDDGGGGGGDDPASCRGNGKGSNPHRPDVSGYGRQFPFLAGGIDRRSGSPRVSLAAAAVQNSWRRLQLTPTGGFSYCVPEEEEEEELMEPLILQRGNLFHPHGNVPHSRDENDLQTGITTSKRKKREKTSCISRAALASNLLPSNQLLLINADSNYSSSCINISYIVITLSSNDSITLNKIFLKMFYYSQNLGFFFSCATSLIHGDAPTQA